MSPPDLLLVAVGAGLGAPLRYVAGHLYDAHDRVPWGTAAVNVIGSLLLGGFAGLALTGSTLALLGTGFCGGLTTYSAFAVQAHRLAGEHRAGAAAYVVGTVVVSLLACALGFVITGGR